MPNPEARKMFRDTELQKFAARQRVFDAMLADARKVAEWDPYDQNGRAGWFAPEHMFGVSGGFDVVIGNPPYIQLQKEGGLLANRYKGAGYETFVRTGDIYQLFFERGCGLLRRDAGVLAYVTSNSWLKAEYGRPLRHWFAERHTPLRLMEIGANVFDAIVDTGILILQEGGKATPIPAVDMDRLEGDRFPPANKHWGEARPSGDAPWSILSDIEWRVLEKMNKQGVPLKNWNVRINYGIKTGYNQAFIIDDNTRDDLIERDPRSAEIIKPILRGRDIKRWRAQWAGKWLIDTHNGFGEEPDVVEPIDVTNYPAVECHLNRFFEKLTSRQDKGKTPYNLRNCTYHEDFSKEKLFWMDLTDTARFSYDNGDIFAVNTAYILVGGPTKFLCAILNSTLIAWFMNNASLTSGMGVTRWIYSSVSRIPIPKPSLERRRPLVHIVDRIIANMESDPRADVIAEEAEIDRLVYELYGLDEQEIAAVENTLRS